MEFVVENFFDTIEDIKKFAGEEYEVAVFEPEARKVLSKVEPIVRHYTVKMDSVTGHHHQ